MLRFKGKVTAKFDSYDVHFSTVRIDFDIAASADYNIPHTEDTKIGDEVILIVSPPSPVVDHPGRRSTDGPAIEGHEIAVVRSITVSDKDREDLESI